MNWGAPEILPWLLLLVPAWWLVFFLLRRREKRLATLIDAGLISTLAPEYSPKRTRQRTFLWLLAISLACLALARPQWGFHWRDLKRRGLDIVVVLDTSHSMRAEDIKPNRLQQAKWAIRDLAYRLKGDRLGLVAFAGGSLLQCPLTIDYGAFLMTLDDVYCGIIPKGGTAIEQALQTAVDGFEEAEGADRAIVLITDGEDHEGDPLRLADEMRKQGIKVFALGVGTLDGELIPAGEGATGFLKDRDGNVVKSALREDRVERLALATGGMYVRSTPSDFGMERIFEHGIADLKRAERESKLTRMNEDRYMWFLAAAFLLLAVEGLIGTGRRPREVKT